MDASRTSALGKRGRGWLAAGLMALPASFCGAACGSQATDDYQGEVLLTIEGNVNVDTSTDLELKLAFYNRDKSAVKVMAGHVSGEFPAKFRFEVTDPPPDDTLLDVEGEFGMRGELAMGFLVLLPPNHASSIPRLEDLGGLEPCEGEDDDGCRIVEECPLTADGSLDCEQPRQRKYSCSQRPCELFASDGDPALGESPPSTTMSMSTGILVPYCYSTSFFCSSIEECYREYYQCDISQIDNYDRLEQDENMVPYIEDCELIEESGAPLFGISDITSAGAGYVIFYVTEDNPETPFGALKQGYNVIAINPLTPEQWQASTSCLGYDPDSGLDNFDMSCIGDEQSNWSVVDDHSLSIDLGAVPSFVGW